MCPDDGFCELEFRSGFHSCSGIAGGSRCLDTGCRPDERRYRGIFLPAAAALDLLAPAADELIMPCGVHLLVGSRGHGLLSSSALVDPYAPQSLHQIVVPEAIL